MTSWARPALWALAVVTGAGAAALTGVAVWVDLDTADRVASVCGAIVAMVGLVVSVAALSRSAQGDMSHISVARDAVVITGDVVGSAVGEGAEVVGPPSPAPPATGRSTGPVGLRVARGGRAFLGSVRDGAIGRNSRRRAP
ncbi:hypothetical protein SUDANB176_00380 [Streptomyces sp. enrichment culture]|uniref:hypothetical protein n=1 Tax=Streptomyces sp. enrichment culture TaxID=1795815 RepID=UPI003F558502